MKHNIKIYKLIIQESEISNTIAFCYDCCKSGRKKMSGSWMGSNSKAESLVYQANKQAKMDEESYMYNDGNSLA